MSVKNDNNTPRYTFQPMNRYMYKLWLYMVLIWSAISLMFVFIGFMASFDNDPNPFPPGLVEFFYLVYGTLTVLGFTIGIIASYIYTRSMKFAIYSNEVVVQKGVVNKTEKHVPYRTITNISSRYGIFDRLFGMGTVEIETAGKSGQSAGPEEKIEGLPNFVEVRDIVLEELRKFRSQYATGTETTEISGSASDSDLPGAILNELREIKNLLAK